MLYQESCHVNLRFVIPESYQSKDGVTDEMKMAFQECVEADFSPEWIREENCLNMKSYTKLDVFIMQEFSGEVFNKLRSTESVVCGPVCLRTCLAERTNIPENNSPVFTTAMRNLCITSDITTQKKIEIIEKVLFMGGIYRENLVESSTHLVTNIVHSPEYKKATEKGMKVMTEKWIEAVWEASLKRNVKATDPEFDKYKCKIFQGLELTWSNLDRAEKEKIKKLVEENGGSFKRPVLQHATYLLVISSPNGDKYKYAKSWKIPCVYPSWLTESLEKGYAVPTKNHLLSTKMKCSTPTIDLSNFTLGAADQCSVISHDTNNETDVSNASVITGRNTRSQISKGSKYKKILKTLSLRKAKRAGSFLESCKIFLSGFTAQEVVCLRQLLNSSGASIFNELSETVSYVIVGDHVIDDLKTISNMTRRPFVVSLEWLAASIEEKSPAWGHLYSCLVQTNIPVEPLSPLSQKVLELRQTTDGNTQDSLPEKQALMTPQPAVSRKKDGEEPKQVVVNESHGTSKDTLMGPPNCSKSSVDIRNGPNCSQSAPNCTHWPICSDLSPFHVDTPDNTRSLKKRWDKDLDYLGIKYANHWKKYLDDFDTYAKEESPTVTQRRDSTEANVSLPNVKKMQSPTTVTETMASSSIGTPEDRVSQHLQKLDREPASHTPPETTLN